MPATTTSHASPRPPAGAGDAAGRTMSAMVLRKAGEPLVAMRLPVPAPAGRDVLVKVSACGVCRTDLQIADGDVKAHRLPLILGHQVAGVVAGLGKSVANFALGDRIGIAWLGGSCGACGYCKAMQENLCDAARFTGYDYDGGYAEYLIADARYAFHLPPAYDDLHVAPMLCGGLIGYRAYGMTAGAGRIGLYGFGSAAHIIAQVARHEGREIFAFTRPGDSRSQQFARSLGAAWAGNADALPPAPLDAAIIFASAGELVPAALAAVRKGGTVVCAGIHMSDIPRFPYSLLWGERTVRSVANLTHADGEAFFEAVRRFDLKTSPVRFPMSQANQALSALREGAFDGAAVLVNAD